MKSSLIVGLSCLALSACDSGPNLAQVCDDHPQLCQEFKEDSWCKKERNQTIFSGAALSIDNKEINQFNLIMALEGYAKCLNLASKIEHIKLKEKTTHRINNYVKATQKLDTLAMQTENAEHPYLLYYHWSRHLDKRALAKFLKLEGTALMETPASQLNLATYYAKRDPKKTLSLLFHALELNTPADTVDAEIFKTLATIFTDKKEYKQAYIWTKVLRLYAPDDKDLSAKALKRFQQAFDLDNDLLDRVAVATLDKIEQGIFKAPRF